MTGSTIVVGASGQRSIGDTIAIGVHLMFVLVMTDVLRCRAAFMLAIAGHCRPGKLERQEKQQEDGQPTSHGA